MLSMSKLLLLAAAPLLATAQVAQDDIASNAVAVLSHHEDLNINSMPGSQLLRGGSRELTTVSSPS